VAITLRRRWQDRWRWWRSSSRSPGVDVASSLLHRPQHPCSDSNCPAARTLISLTALPHQLNYFICSWDCEDGQKGWQNDNVKKGKGSPYSITECRVPELIPVVVQWVWTVCLRLLPDSVATAIWTEAFCAWVQHANQSATEPTPIMLMIMLASDMFIKYVTTKL